MNDVKQPLVNEAVVLENLAGDQELFLSIISMFFEEKHRSLEIIRAALEKKNAEKLCSAAHALKGSIAHFTTQGPHALAKELEAMGRNHELADAANVLAQLEIELEKLESELLAIESRSGQ